jgi:hypothetical protein
MTTTPEPQPARGLVATLSKRWRWAFAGGAGAVIIGLVAWPLLTYVGIPEDRYSSAPDPCQLLSDQTLQELIGSTESVREIDSTDLPGGSAVGLTHRSRQRACLLDGVGAANEARESSVDLTVYWYSSTQLNLGPSGEERAERHFDLNLETRELGEAECSYLPRDNRTNVCGTQYSRFGANVFIHRENLYVVVSFSSVPATNPYELPGGWLEERMVDVTGDVLAVLDTAP